MTYLASISLIQEVTSVNNDQNNSNTTNTLISILILVKLLPNVLFLPIGGILADSYDRRKIQVALDLCMSSVVMVFLWSLYSKSIPLCLLANFLIETGSGLYIPSNQAMLPHLFDTSHKEEKHQQQQLKKATVLYGMSWSLMAAVGSSLGGVLVAAFGIKGCFIIDSATYVISAAFLWFGVHGDYNASSSPVTKDDDDPSFPTSASLLLDEDQGSEMMEDDDDNKSRPMIDSKYDSSSSSGLLLFVECMKFLFVEYPLVGACALLKGSAELTLGAVDVLNVSFSSRGLESDPSLKLGMLFGCVGVGCILGSVVCDALSDLAFPQRIARVTLCGFVCISLAMFWMAATPDVFWSLCLSTVIRSIGSAVVWVNSTLLIQKYTPQTLLGRVSSFDSGVALFAEAISALGGGLLLDQEGFSAEGLSLVLAGIAMLFFFAWSPLLIFRF